VPDADFGARVDVLRRADGCGYGRSRCSAHGGADEVAMREWGYLERVSTGLYATSFGASDLGRPYLETAELLVGESG
jgi:hypothetical protein